MGFFSFLHRQSLFLHYVTALIVFVGLASLFMIQREARPNVNFNRLAVAVVFPGASPQDVEQLVIDPLEEKIQEVDGVKEFRSVSFSGAGSIAIEIDDSYANPDKIMEEIRRKIGEVRNLPEGTSDPVVTDIKAVNIPVLRLAIYGDLDPLTMKSQIAAIQDHIKKTDGVQSISFSGLTDLQLKLKTRPKELDEYDMTLLEMLGALTTWSRQKSGGLLETSLEASNISIGKDYATIPELESFVLRSNDSGKSVQVQDVSEVTFETESSQQISTFAGKKAVLMTIIKKPKADIVRTVTSVKTALKEFEDKLSPKLKYKLYTDESIRVRTQLKIVGYNAIFGLIFVLIILILNLDWRSALVTSIGIPVALLGGIIILYASGTTLNSLVLIGMIVVLGMLVDDAIVVCENIYRKLEEGLSPFDAAVEGTREIAIPVVATVLTTIFAFMPILYLEGILGQFISVIPLTVIIMLFVSLFEALVILPIHAKEIMRPRPHKQSPFVHLENIYRRYLTWTVDHRWATLGVLTIIMGATFFQGGAVFSKFTLFPPSGLTGASIRVEMERNTPIAKTAELTNQLSSDLEAIAGGDFESVFANMGQVRTGGNAGSRQNGSHLASISIFFTSDPSFLSREKALMKQIRKTTREFSKKNQINASVNISRPGPPVGRPIQYQITSRDFKETEEVSGKVMNLFKRMDGVESLLTDVDGNTKSYRFVVDHSLAVSEGVQPNQISRTVFAATTGVVTSEILRNNEKVEILVKLNISDDYSVDDILKLRVRNRVGESVPIGNFTKLIVEKGPSSIQRLDGVRTITIFGDVNENIISGAEANRKVKKEIQQIKDQYPNASIIVGGGEKDRISALKNTFQLYGLAIVLIFMVISLSFQSLIYPFLVLLAIPFGLVGVIWTFTLPFPPHDSPISLMALVGMVGLSGVVVNISIIFLNFVQMNIENGLSLKEAVIQAGVRRLRPILLTSITTLIGLLPSIYGFGGTDSFVQPLSLVLGWGLAVGTTLSVLFLPSVISFFTVIAKSKT